MLKMLLVAAVVTVGGARKDALWNDDFVVTNVTVDLGHLATTNQLAAATGAVEAAAAAKLAAATNDLAGTMRGGIVSASNNLAAAMSHDIAAATNRMESAMGERLEPYATRGWVEGRGYATGPEMRATVREDVRVAVAAAMTGMDGRTAHRLMAPGADGWIDGTGAVWRVERAATWNGETTTNRYDNGTSQGWHAEGWYCGYTAYTSATGTWHLVRYLDAAKRLAVEYVGDGLPGDDGQYEVIAKGVTLDGMPAEPGQVTERGWYQIGDGSSLYYVSPLAETVTVTRVTNAVDRLALASEAGAHGGMTTNDVCGIVTNVVELDEWTFSGDVAPGVTYTVDLTGYWYDADTGEAYDEPGEGRYWEGEIAIYGSDGSMGGPEYELPDATSHTFDMYRDEGGETVDAGRITATRRHEERNVLGLARLSDIAPSVSNTVATMTALSPVYSQTPTFGGWTIRPSGKFTDVIWGSEFGGYEWLLSFDDYPIQTENRDPNATSVSAEDNDGTIYTATRVRTDIIGYTLGAQSDKPLQPQGDYATESSLAAVSGEVAQVEEQLTPIMNSVNAMWATMYGESVWIAVTNHMRQVAGTVPSMRLWEVRDDSTNLVYSSAEEIEHVVTQKLHTVETNLTAKMPRTAWGSYQSSGEDNPSSNAVTVVNSQKIMLTGGGEWYRTIETGSAAVWVLKSSGLTSLGGDTNGYFRVCDLEGNAQIEVVKTADQIVEAVAYDVGFDGGGNFTVTFNASGSTHPKVSCADDLADDFVEEDDGGEINSLGITVTWAKGGNNLWVATIHQDIHSPHLFVCGKMTVEGENLVRNNAPTSLSGGIYINNVKYRLVPYTSGGKTYLTLEEW